MRRLFTIFSEEANYYLVMNAFFAFASALSAIFLNVFLWKLDSSFSLLAMYSFFLSFSILASFSLCAWFARKTTPMASLRLGILCHILTYLLMLILKDSLSSYVILLGTLMGLAISFYSVGAHMAILDMTTNEKRDRFLYAQGIVATIGGLAGPLLAGFIIELFTGTTGYYLVFGLSVIFYFLAMIASMKVEGSPIQKVSYLMEVFRKPTREWKGMYIVSFGDGIVSGVYQTFLITMMIYSVAGGEMSLGIFNTLAELVSIIAFLWLAKASSPKLRLPIFAIGAIGLSLASIFLSMAPFLLTLILFTILKPITSNMIYISMNALLYEAIEKDPQYKEKRLDYIIIREIPLGVGRMLGVGIFLWMRSTFEIQDLLSTSFAVFPVIYIIMIPLLYLIWNKKSNLAVTS
ncbi:hypothetical protein CU633_18475 [Bacillus sp. V3-13]|uniref:MFS transporter n=1 Tax=Bacillus sp. V3-13 TaxID=2053728 RepID=UPI000C75C2E7|nr:MFS transporter [Bacillus sp. V3-13]PLR75867.1 hypothetical protein CU633_18475 [Bacillus sp. V3-13]